MKRLLGRLARIADPYQSTGQALLVLLSLLIAALAYAAAAEMPLIIDEKGHARQILSFAAGDWELIKDRSGRYDLGMLPGFHLVMAGVASVTGGTGPAALRAYVALFSLGLALCAWGVARTVLPAPRAPLRAAQLYFLGTLFPFHFLVFTDVLSLCLLTAALLATLRKRYALAGLIALAALGVRQSTVTFSAMLFVLAYLQERQDRPPWLELRDHLVRCWSLVLTGLAFLTWVAVHGGVSLSPNNPLGVSLGNVYGALITCWVVLLPLHVSNLRRIGRLVKARWAPCLALGAVLFVALNDFFPHHGWNRLEYLARNHVLGWLILWGVAGKALFALVIWWTLLSLACTSLAHLDRRLFAAYAFLTLTPNMLIEPRYYLPMLMLLVLLRRPRGLLLETCIWAHGLAVGIAIHRMHVRAEGAFFL